MFDTVINNLQRRVKLTVGPSFSILCKCRLEIKSLDTVVFVRAGGSALVHFGGACTDKDDNV